mgnify:FL=1
MLYRFFVLTLVFAVLVAPPSYSQDLLTDDSIVFDAFDVYLDSLRTQAGIPGLSAIIVGQNDILWEKSYGQQNRELAIPAQIDTPYHIGGMTQIFTTTLIMRCVEDGKISLDDLISQDNAGTDTPDITVRQLLSHTVDGLEGLEFHFDNNRFDLIESAVVDCTGYTLREGFTSIFDQLGMGDSVPGADILEIFVDEDDVLRAERYAAILARLAAPYASDLDQQPVLSEHPITTLFPSEGLISSARDLALFDIELRNGILVNQETLSQTWTPSIGKEGELLPYGYGWFVTHFGTTPIMWQFGLGENASSSIFVTAPSHGLTLVLLANSDGLAKPFALETGDLLLSPFARVFLELLLR